MFKSLYSWLLKQAAGPRAEIVLAALAFAESSFFPLPPDLMLAPMVLAKPERTWRSAAVCSIASVLGGFLGYFIGYHLQGLGLAILKFFGETRGLAAYQAWFAHWGFVFILVKGLTPIPYKITTIAAGLARFSLLQFLLASALTRTARFFLVAWLFKRYGPAISRTIKKRFYLVAGILILMIIVGFVALKLFGG